MIYIITTVAIIGYIIITCIIDKEISMSFKEYIKRKFIDGFCVGFLYGILLYIKEYDFIQIIIRVALCTIIIVIVKSISYILCRAKTN